MQGSELRSSSCLNRVLLNELTAINQYFLHSQDAEELGDRRPRQARVRRIARRDAPCRPRWSSASCSSRGCPICRISASCSNRRIGEARSSNATSGWSSAAIPAGARGDRRLRGGGGLHHPRIAGEDPGGRGGACRLAGDPARADRAHGAGKLHPACTAREALSASPACAETSSISLAARTPRQRPQRGSHAERRIGLLRRPRPAPPRDRCKSHSRWRLQMQTYMVRRTMPPQIPDANDNMLRNCECIVNSGNFVGDAAWSGGPGL